ncbi:cuticle protein 8 [Drosophila sechellia]|nr:cuticle protein 8 [Drosophila sechellia]
MGMEVVVWPESNAFDYKSCDRDTWRHSSVQEPQQQPPSQQIHQIQVQAKMFALVSLFILGVGAAAAIELPIYHSPAAIVKPLLKTVEVEAPAHYDFAYSVHDEHTGDIKSQTESRKGDQVQGQYTLVDADGYLRTVDYTSDAHNGFNAVVRRDPLGQKVIKAAPIAKLLAPAPLPLAYAAPKLLAPAKLPLGLYH